MADMRRMHSPSRVKVQPAQTEVSVPMDGVGSSTLVFTDQDVTLGHRRGSALYAMQFLSRQDAIDFFEACLDQLRGG